MEKIVVLNSFTCPSEKKWEGMCDKIFSLAEPNAIQRKLNRL